MELPSEVDAIKVVARRIDFLEQLQKRPSYKPGLVDSLSHSRSTVDRAVNELEREGLIKREQDGYVTTQSGRLAAERYRLFMDEAQTILESKSVIDAVPPNWNLPIELFADARVTSVDGPYGVFGHITDVMKTDGQYRVMLPQLVDSRHVRLWHARVLRQGLGVELLASSSLLTGLREEFPELSNELAETDSFVAHSVDAPPYGLVLGATESDQIANSETVLMITYDDQGVAGVITTTNPAAVAWATEQYDRRKQQSERATAQLRSNHARDELPTLAGSRLPLALRSEGFRRFDRPEFQSEGKLAPDAGWRAGLGLPEVAAGYAVERRRRDGSSVVETVRDRLEDNPGVALIGPPGSGKSTVCKQIACRWVSEQEGVVLYRESGSGEPFQSVSLLERFIEQATVPVLVVVEDALRLETYRIFEALRSVTGRDSVQFLFDARETEWREPDESILGARLDAFRRGSVTAVSMPPIDETECRRLIEGAEGILETTLDVEPAELLSKVRSTADETAMPATMLLLSYRIAKLARPLTETEESTITTLDADVDSVRANLTEIGETALDAGVLLNTLNAAGIEIAPSLAYSVASRGEPAEHAAVEAALEQLLGHIVFKEPSETTYRGIHESWSERFLERLLEVDGEYAATQRFGRCLSALFALADDPARCDHLARVASGQTPVLDRVVTTPSEWADQTVESIFEIGPTNAKLAPLFGMSEDSAIDLPAACSSVTERRCIELRGRMYRIAGKFTHAQAEFEQLATVARAQDDCLLEAKALRQLGRVTRQQGNYDDAREYYNQSLQLARELGEKEHEAGCLSGLGVIARHQSRYDRATERFEQASEIATACETRELEAKMLNNLGIIAYHRDEYETAQTYFERSLAIMERRGDRFSQASNLNNLGAIFRWQNKYDKARTCYERSLSIRREIGDRRGEAAVRTNIAEILRRQGDPDTALTYAQAGLELAQAVDHPRQVGHSLLGIGAAHRMRGEFDDARAALATASEQYEAVGDQSKVAEVRLEQGRLALACERIEAATESATTALEQFEQLEKTHDTARCRTLLGKIAAADGDPERASHHWQTALETFESVGAPHDTLGTLKLLYETSEQLSKTETQQWLRRAKTVFDDAPEAVRTIHEEWLCQADAP